MGITWRNLCLCFQKQKSEVLPREAHVALRETRGPQENSGPQNATPCHLPMERDPDGSGVFASFYQGDEGDGNSPQAMDKFS